MLREERTGAVKKPGLSVTATDGFELRPVGAQEGKTKSLSAVRADSASAEASNAFSTEE